MLSLLDSHVQEPARESSSECRNGSPGLEQKAGAEKAWKQTFQEFHLNWDEAMRQAQPSQRMNVL